MNVCFKNCSISLELGQRAPGERILSRPDLVNMYKRTAKRCKNANLVEKSDNLYYNYNISPIFYELNKMDGSSG